MATDLRLLTWLRWRQLRRAVDYWLRVTGYDSYGQSWSNRLYGIYLLLIGAGWFWLMWVLAVSQVSELGVALTGNEMSLRQVLQTVVPWVIVVAEAVITINALRGSPVKLSYEDIAYVAGSPFRRSAVVLASFVQSVITRLLVIVPVVTLLGVLAAQVPQGNAFGQAGLPAALTALPVVTLLMALAWLAGAARLAYPDLRRRQFLWLLAPILIIPLSVLLPGMMALPGAALAGAILGQPSPVPILLVALAAAAALGGLIWLGERVNLIDVTDESRDYARVKALGYLTRLMSPDTAKQVRAQSKVGRRRPFFHLPPSSGYIALVLRAGLTYFRRPWPLLRAVLWTTAIAVAAGKLTSTAVPASVWLPWLTIIAITPSRGFLMVFQSDLTDPFRRQLLPVNNLLLLLADTALPLSLVSLATLVIWFVLGGMAMLGSARLSITMAVVLMLCQGAGMVRIPALDREISSTIWIGISFGAILIASNLVSPAAAPVVAGMATLALGSLMAKSPDISAVPV